jgi:hypothetical protein
MRRPTPGVKRDRPGWSVDVVVAIDWTWDRCHVTISGPGSPVSAAAGQEGAAVDLYWLPLGAGGHFVRLNGRVFEAMAARAARRPVCDLYHSALEVRVAAARFVIEQAPVRDAHGEQRGVVAEGPVGMRWAARFRIFRAEIRRWRDGQIPDVDEAVESPRRLTDEETRAQRVLDLAPQVPTPVWGRDDLETGDMWNSNSVIAWLIARSEMDIESIHLRQQDACRDGKPGSWSHAGRKRRHRLRR